MQKGYTNVQNAAIFGGSFDPPHNGHLSIIKRAIEKLDIDKLYVMPNFLNPFKHKSKASAQLRYEWLKKMTASMQKVSVSDFEIKKGYPVPTIETVEHFLHHYDKIYFIIGADNLDKLHKWQDYERLQQLVSFVVATRQGQRSKDFICLDVDENISSTQMRQNPQKDCIPPSIYKQVKETYEATN